MRIDVDLLYFRSLWKLSLFLLLNFQEVLMSMGLQYKLKEMTAVRLK